MLVPAPGLFSTTNCWPSYSRHLRGEQARVDVDAAAGREADDEAHRAGGIGLGERIGGHGKSDGEQEETHAGNVAQ